MTTSSQLKRMENVFWIAIVVGIIAFVYLFKGILLPFVLGMAIAYALDPLADRLEALKIPRTLVTLLLLAGFFGIGVLVLVLVVPLLGDQFANLVQAIPSILQWGKEHVLRPLQDLRSTLGPAKTEQLSEVVKSSLGSAVKDVATLLTEILSGGIVLFDVVSLLIITPVVSFYLLKDWDRIVAQIDTYLPREYAPVIREQARQMDQIISAFVRGVGTVALVMAVYYAAALSIAGLEYGLLIGIAGGTLTIVPVLGSATGFIVAVLLSIIQFDRWSDVFVVAGLYGFGIFLESYVLTPRLVGNKVRLHPVWVLFALLAGGVLFGFVGVLLSVPVAAVIGVLVRFGADRYRHSPLYRGVDPGVGPGIGPEL